MIILVKKFSDRYHWRQPYDDMMGEKVIDRDIITKNGKRLEGNEATSAFRTMMDDLVKDSKKYAGKKAVWDKKKGELLIQKTKFDGEKEAISKAAKEGHQNRRTATIFKSTGNKSAREAYRGFLEYEDTLNPHFKIAKESKEAIKKEIRRAERNHKIKKGLAIGALATGTAAAIGGAAKKIYDKKKKDKE